MVHTVHPHTAIPFRTILQCIQAGSGHCPSGMLSPCQHVPLRHWGQTIPPFTHTCIDTHTHTPEKDPGLSKWQYSRQASLETNDYIIMISWLCTKSWCRDECQVDSQHTEVFIMSRNVILWNGMYCNAWETGHLLPKGFNTVNYCLSVHCLT